MQINFFSFGISIHRKHYLFTSWVSKIQANTKPWKFPIFYQAPQALLIFYCARKLPTMIRLNNNNRGSTAQQPFSTLFLHRNNYVIHCTIMIRILSWPKQNDHQQKEQHVAVLTSKKKDVPIKRQRQLMQSCISNVNDLGAWLLLVLLSPNKLMT